MTTMMFLTITNGKLMLDTIEITSLDHFKAVCPAEGCVRSSSVDFPDEYTTDPAVLAIVAALNGVTTEECPACHRMALLSDEPEGATRFTEPLCDDCRAKALREASMDSFDIAYERARANGWED